MQETGEKQSLYSHIQGQHLSHMFLCLAHACIRQSADFAGS